jgi:CheY-like chemotaxis protein
VSKSILIIEDEPEVLQLLTHILKPGQYDIAQALGGAQALAALQSTAPDLVILDLAMPGINGLDLLETIRQSPQLAHTKVVVVTARPTLAEKALEYKGLVVQLFYKPVRPVQLLHAVRELLQPGL